MSTELTEYIVSV